MTLIDEKCSHLVVISPILAYPVCSQACVDILSVISWLAGGFWLISNPWACERTHCWWTVSPRNRASIHKVAFISWLEIRNQVNIWKQSISAKSPSVFLMIIMVIISLTWTCFWLKQRPKNRHHWQLAQYSWQRFGLTLCPFPVSLSRKNWNVFIIPTVDRANRAFPPICDHPMIPSDIQSLFYRLYCCTKLTVQWQNRKGYTVPQIQVNHNRLTLTRATNDAC